MQDSAPFIPELLEALSGHQTPGRKGWRGGRFNFLLLLQTILTSLVSFTNLLLHMFREA
jgi:hypothetical protein